MLPANSDIFAVTMVTWFNSCISSTTMMTQRLEWCNCLGRQSHWSVNQDWEQRFPARYWPLAWLVVNRPLFTSFTIVAVDVMVLNSVMTSAVMIKTSQRSVHTYVTVTWSRLRLIYLVWLPLEYKLSHWFVKELVPTVVEMMSVVVESSSVVVEVEG